MQTACIGAVCSGSTLFASTLNVRQLFAADDFSRQHFQMHFFLGALRAKGSTLFASILNSPVILGNYLEKTTSADDIFRCIFFLAL